MCMAHEKYKHYVAKACVEISGKNRGWQNKSSSVGESLKNSWRLEKEEEQRMGCLP